MSAAIFNGAYVKLLKDKLKFKTTGSIEWDAANGCPSYPSDIPNVTNQIGQETHVRVYNPTGSTILNGKVVYIEGADVDNTHPAIMLAVANTYHKSRILGVVTADILSGEHGIVTVEGIVNGLDTSTYTAGDVLYLSPTTPGEFTNVAPNDGNFSNRVGTVTRVDATTGAILVFTSSAEYTVETTQKTGWSTTYGNATMAFVDGALGATRTLTLTPVGSEFHFYQDGIKYSKATDSIQITDVEGMHVIYYNLGVLTSIANPTLGQVDSIIRNNVTVAYVYWDFANRIHLYLGNELHDLQFPPLVHAYNHFAYGARYLTGLGLNSILSEQTGALDTHAQFGVDQGAIADEDIYLPSPAIASTTGLPIFYLAGTSASPTLRKLTNAGFSVSTIGTGRLAYNFLNAGNWTIAEVTSTDFVLCHVFEINENTSTKRMVAFMGQAQYATVALAREGATTEIASLQSTGILPQEKKSVATIIFQTSNAYGNAVKARIREVSSGVNYVDWRSLNTTGGGVAGGGTVTIFSDSTFQVYDDADPTKTFQLQASGITTGTNRVATIPDRNFSFGEMSAWATSTNYSSISTIYYGPTRRIYKSTVAHTSGTWATDLAAGKWVEISPTKQIAPLQWTNSTVDAAIEDFETYGRLRYGFESGLSQKIRTSFVVPHDYVSGTQLKLWFKVHCATAATATVLLTAVSTLLRNDTDALSSVTNQNTSSNVALAINTAGLDYYVEANLTDVNGAINSVAISPKDTINIELTRGTDSNTDIGYMFPSNTGVLL